MTVPQACCDAVDVLLVTEQSFITPKQRVMTSLPGVLSALIGMPFLMSIWAPITVTALWWFGYFLISAVAWALVLHKSEVVEYWWSASVGVMFGLLPISAQVFDPGTTSVWIASFVALLAIAVELSSLPYVPIFEWRVGPGCNGALITAVVVLEIGPVGLLLIPALISIFQNGDRMRSGKIALQESVVAAVAESAIAQEMAVNDELTGLLNRRGLTMELERLEAEGEYTIVMFDADRFKAINDAYGHGVGDYVLQHMATAISERLPAPWVVARQGGDEFVAVAGGHGISVPTTVCAPIDCVISIYGADAEIKLGISGGVVRANSGDEVDRVLSKAGYVMREAKRGNGGLARFGDQLETRFERMLEISAATQDGLDEADFDADFQIVVHADGTILGFEALCRWRRPDGTTVQPDQFLPILSESGRMPRLNELMLRKGIAFAARFNDLDEGPFVAVNIGSSHLGSAGLVPLIRSLLDEYRVDPNRLMIEITEQEFFTQEALWHRDALELQDLGVCLAIDDFGAGYSNIDRLNTLPISHLKFDRSLASAVSGPLGEVIEGVVRFADATQVGIIAEGIETDEELAAMSTIGVVLFQGFLFARPESADDVEARVRRGLSAQSVTLPEAA